MEFCELFGHFGHFGHFGLWIPSRLGRSLPPPMGSLTGWRPMRPGVPKGAEANIEKTSDRFASFCIILWHFMAYVFWLPVFPKIWRLQV